MKRDNTGATIHVQRILKGRKQVFHLEQSDTHTDESDDSDGNFEARGRAGERFWCGRSGDDGGVARRVSTGTRARRPSGTAADSDRGENSAGWSASS